MKWIFLFAVFMGSLSPHAVQAMDLISPTPHCAIIENTTEFTIFGSIRSEYGTTSSGEKRRHEANFRLAPDKKQEVCVTGPFFPGYQVELSLKTLIPIFSCKTRLKGTIEIRSEKRDDDSNRIYALCLP